MRRLRRAPLLPAAAALALLALTGCADDGTTAAPVTSVGTGVGTDTTDALDEGTSTTVGEPTAVPTAVATSTLPGERCVSPEGYSVALPTGWVTNPGDVAPRCSYLNPEPFTVPEATDARPAAISLYVDPVPFDEVSAERDPQTSRDQATVAGVDAVRVEAVEDGSRLYPEGTRRTSWYVDLPPTVGQEGPRTLIADVVVPPSSDLDYDELTAVLDRLITTLQLETVTGTTP